MTGIPVDREAVIVSRRKRFLAIFTVLTTFATIGTAIFLYGSWRQSRDFLVNETDFYIVDSLANHVHRPNAIRQYAWPEHEKGRIILKTNNLGFREDADTSFKKAEHVVRILVTGDSHTDGVVYNSESFANVLERLLNSNSSSSKFEVINGGAGYYTFQNYSGFLRKYIDLRPDQFIVTIYTGNDFLEAISTARKSGQVRLPMTPIWQRLKLRSVPAAPVGQVLNQIVYFKSYPEMKEVALGIAESELSKIKKVCAEEQIGLLVLLLPTKVDVEGQATVDAQTAKFDLTETELSVSRELGQTLSKWMEKNDMKHLDLTEYMRSSADKLYWIEDYHLSSNGHSLVAELIFKNAKFLDGQQ